MRTIRKQAFAWAMLLAAVLFLPEAWGQFSAAKKPSRRSENRITHLKEMESRVFRLTNEVRRKKGLPLLDKDEALTATARAHSDDMLRRNFFSHVNPDGLSPKDRLAPVAAATMSRAGENIWSGSGQDYADSKLLARVIVDSWMSSPGHRANILNPDYTHVGIGIGVMGKEIRATQVFAQIKSRK